MYIHIGNDVEVLSDDIIGIFDIESTSVSKMTVNFLSQSQKDNKIYTVSMDMPKAFVVCSDKTYITNIANITISKRCKNKKTDLK